MGGSISAWWECISGVSVPHVRAMGAHGEGWATCIGGQGVARCGRSSAGSCGVMWGCVEAVWRQDTQKDLLMTRTCVGDIEMHVGNMGMCVGDTGMHAGDAGTHVGHEDTCWGCVVLPWLDSARLCSTRCQLRLNFKHQKHPSWGLASQLHAQVALECD